MKKWNATPPACPTCGSLKRTRKEGSRVLKFSSPQIVNGVECNAIRLSYVTCNNCGQRYVVREPADVNG